MSKVIITTDFSKISRHSLNYACYLLAGRDVAVELLHIYSMPVSYAADGIAMSAIGNSIEVAEDNIEQELKYARTSHPGIPITGRVVTGNFVETLQEEANAIQPSFIVLGTAGFTDINFGEDDPLNALRSLSVPVLFIPFGSEIRPIHHVAYACDYAGVGAHTPVRDIAGWVQLMQARLEVVHSDAGDRGADDKQTRGEEWLRGQLEPLQPDFDWEKAPDVLAGITRFISDHDIDCVAMVPKKYGMWERLFRQSRTKALARLNKIPVIAFNPKG